MTNGILYVAAGEAFVNEAKISAASAKRVMPNVPIAIVSDQNIDSGLFDTSLDLDSPRFDGGDKIQHLLRSPYERTLFVDTDIYFADTIHELFDITDEFDFGIASNGPFYKSLERNRDSIPTAFPEYNSGVMIYKKTESVREFLNKWESAFLKDAEDDVSHNQPSLRKTLYESDLRFTVLPRRYNCIFRRPAHVNDTVKILHGRLLDVDSFGANKSIDPKKVAEKLNSRTDNRVSYQSGSSVRVKPGVVDRFQNSLYHNGIVGTFLQLIKKARIQ